MNSPWIVAIVTAFGIAAIAAPHPAFADPRKPYVSSSAGGATAVRINAVSRIKSQLGKTDNQFKQTLNAVSRVKQREQATQDRVKSRSEKNAAINRQLQNTADKQREIRCQFGGC